MLLPWGAEVLKTVTVRLGGGARGQQQAEGAGTHGPPAGGDLILWSTVGDAQIERSHLRHVGEALGLSRRAVRSSVINPEEVDPEEAYGMYPGMVSPFLPRGRPAHLRALVMVWPADLQQTKTLAISLSPFESLLLRMPLAEFRLLLHLYLKRAAPPGVRLLTLQR